MEHEVQQTNPVFVIKQANKFVTWFTMALSIAAVRYVLELILVVIVAIGFIYVYEYLRPKSVTYRGIQVTKNHYNVANQVGALASGESIECFYQDGDRSVNEYFCIVTDKRVVIYDKSAQGTPIISADLGKVHDVGIYALMTSTISLTMEDGAIIDIVVARDNNADSVLYNAILDGMTKVGNIKGIQLFKMAP